MAEIVLQRHRLDFPVSAVGSTYDLRIHPIVHLKYSDQSCWPWCPTWTYSVTRSPRCQGTARSLLMHTWARRPGCVISIQKGANATKHWWENEVFRFIYPTIGGLKLACTNYTVLLRRHKTCKNLYALNPSCVGEPCPTQPKQVKTIPTIEVGKEVKRHLQYGLMLTVSPQQKKNEHMYKWRTGRWKRPRDLRSMWIPTPRHKTQIRVRSMTTTGISLERIPIHSVKAVKPSCIMGRGKTGVPGEKTATRA